MTPHGRDKAQNGVKDSVEIKKKKKKLWRRDSELRDDAKQMNLLGIVKHDTELRWLISH